MFVVLQICNINVLFLNTDVLKSQFVMFSPFFVSLQVRCRPLFSFQSTATPHKPTVTQNSSYCTSIQLCNSWLVSQFVNAQWAHNYTLLISLGLCQMTLWEFSLLKLQSTNSGFLKVFWWLVSQGLAWSFYGFKAVVRLFWWIMCCYVDATLTKPNHGLTIATTL